MYVNINISLLFCTRHLFYHANRQLIVHVATFLPYS